LKASIRSVNSGDVAALAVLNAEVQELHFASRPDEFKPVHVDEIAQWFVQLLQNPAARLWGAEVDGALVGYVVVLVREKPENPFCSARKWWDIDQMGVGAGSRRAGIGRALVEQVVSEARARGIANVELNSWAFNQEAHRAFARMGFVAKAVRFELRASALPLKAAT
jgi:GNAT superfamily N-acetyltransferase